MSLLHFIKLILRNLKLLVLVPLVLAGSVYYFTRNEKKVYSSESVVYTGIASGYSLSGDKRPDYFATSNAFDNLLSLISSRETKQEVALRLLAEHLHMKVPPAALLAQPSYVQMQATLGDAVCKKLKRATVEATYEAVIEYLQSRQNNEVYVLLNSDNAFYSIGALQNISALRINSSDLIKITYQTCDAAICKRTLELLEETFMRKHRNLREGQTESVIAYFEAETKKSMENLDGAERDFLEFNKGNDIINYYEQTKAVAGEKEHLYSLGHSLEMDLEASGKALGKINANLEQRSYNFLSNNRIIEERDALSKLYSSIAVYESLGSNVPADNTRVVEELKRKAYAQEQTLKAALDKYYRQNNTPEGLPGKEILDEWLKTTIAYEQGKARLAVMDKRKIEFQEEYRKFAPLGAMLKKIERQISVAEQAYLEMLHGLNLARLQQQNTALTTKLTIVDPPYLPLRPNASTRVMMVAISFVAGFILVLSVLLARYLLNRTLQEPHNATKKIGLPVLAVYPVLQQSPYLLSKANLRLLQQVLSVAPLKGGPLKLGFISVQEKEGKTEVATALHQGLTSMDLEADYIQWTNESKRDDMHANTIRLVELPALEQYVFTGAALPVMDDVFLVVRANRIWNQVDKDMLANFQKVSGIKPKVILNGVDVDFAEVYIGEVPKKRSALRSFLKRIIKFEFGNRKRIRKA